MRSILGLACSQASAAIAVFSRYRHCLIPFGVALLSLGVCYCVGAKICGFAEEHVAFEIFVATAAVTVHFSMHEAMKRVRANRHRTG